jgi:SRSO17 transposase
MALDLMQQRLAAFAAGQPDGPLGMVGVIDETSTAKKGEQTPGVQRQGCVGKIDTRGMARGTIQALLDAELYLPPVVD